VRAEDIAARVATVPGVVGVTLGGSRARGTHRPDSDVDLGVYYRPPLDTAALGAVARSLAGPAATVTEPGGWGPWVDGGGWLTIDGRPVDLIYRDLDRVHASWRAAEAGRPEWHFQVGHPLGVPSTWYAAELALARVLHDPTGELTALHRRPYPAALRTPDLWEARFLLAAARKGVDRADAAYVAGCLFRVVGLCAHAVHAAAGAWLVNEKGAVEAAGRLPTAPPDFAARAPRLLAAPGSTPTELAATLTAATALVDAIG
jgi:predicted nucleotidyltransferase